MQAVRFVGVGRPAQIEDVPAPSPGPGQALIGSVAPGHAARICAETTEFPLSKAVDVYARLKAGKITGRAVLIPAWHDNLPLLR